MLAVLTALSFAIFGLSGIAAAQTTARGVAPSVHAASGPVGLSGTTVNPLQANCGLDHPSCGHVGESYADYNGNNVELLYSENYYCDSNVSSKAGSGCEVGAPPSATPSGISAGNTGTTLGNTTSGDTLYIPVPLGFTPNAPTQCPANTANITCIDHPSTVDLSRIAQYLPGKPSPAAVQDAFVPAHDHVVTTTNGNKPEWWNVKVVPVGSQAALTAIQDGRALSAAQLQPFNPSTNPGGYIPSNLYLFFQVLPGTVPFSVANNPANLNEDFYPATGGYSAAPGAMAADQSETGSTFNNLNVDCQGGGANCEGIGIAHGYVSGTPGGPAGQDVQLLYSENYFCGAPQGAAAPKPKSSTGCEVGYPGAVPPGVSDRTVATAKNSAPGASGGNSQIDPLYIPVPLGFTPTYTQCPTAITCIDHPPTIDLSAIAAYLPGHPAASALTNVPLPSHDHVLRTRNGDLPEWWNVEVVPVTSQAALDAIQNSQNLTLAQEQGFNPNSNPGGAIDTNVYLWFQTLPGAGIHTPGPGAALTAATPTPGECTATLPAGSAVAGADLPDGTGYVETDAAGDVAVFGAGTCYGSLTGVHLNKPIVGIAVDRTTGGYWLVASDGGIFNFNAPFLGSTGNIALNKPVVGIATNLNSTGYALVASDGGIFTFGGVKFEGSTGSVRLNKPVVGMAFDPATPYGYYLVASDGGIFDFGGAPFFGSTGNVALNKPIVALSPLLSGTGYTEIASDGGTFQKGSAAFLGSLGNIRLNYPIVSAGTDYANNGFTDFAADGGVFTFGSPFYGSAA